MNIKKQREQAEELVYRVMDALDPTETNSTYYKEKFASMSDAQFINFLKSSELPFKFQTEVFKIEPSMTQAKKALDILQVPLTESIYLPDRYVNKKGQPVKSKECLVIYSHQKKMKQFVTHKNSTPIDIANRDMRNGLLMGNDKGGKESDREAESLMAYNLTNTAKELMRPRADAMTQKSTMYNTINLTGKVSLQDLPDEPDDVLSRNYLDAYLIGAQLKSNLITDGDYLISTIKNRKRKTERES